MESAAWVVVRSGWHGSDFNVVARCLLFFLQNRYWRFAEADLPISCSDVADCPMCTPADWHQL